MLKAKAGENFPARFSQQIRGQTLQRGLKYTPIAMFILSFFLNRGWGRLISQSQLNSFTIKRLCTYGNALHIRLWIVDSLTQ